MSGESEKDAHDEQAKPAGGPSAKDLIAEISDFYDAEVFLYSGPINEDGFGGVVKQFVGADNSKKAILILVTYGGLANSAYRISRFFQRNFEEFLVYIPSYCKSAGTLITLGAHKVVVSPFSELGPLDVQLLKPDEIAERKSGLLTRSAITRLNEHAFELFEDFILRIKQRSAGLISFRTASDVASRVSSELLSNVYAQLDPNIIGEDFQDLRVATEYGVRLVKNSNNTSIDAVHYLVEGFPSHDFVIDCEEIHDLFTNVEDASPSLHALSVALRNHGFFQPNERAAVERLTSLVDASDASSGADTRQEGDDDSDNSDAAHAAQAADEAASVANESMGSVRDGDRDCDTESS